MTQEFAVQNTEQSIAHLQAFDMDIIVNIFKIYKQLFS